MNKGQSICLGILGGMLTMMGVLITACRPTTSIQGVKDRWDFTDVHQAIVSSSLPLTNTWRFTASLSIYWAPVVERDTVLVRSVYGLEAVDGDTGQKKWKYPLERSSGEEFPLAIHGDVVALAGRQHVRVLDFESGQEIWRQEMTSSESKTMGAGWVYSLAVDEERVYAAGAIVGVTSQVEAYDIHSGVLLWRQHQLGTRTGGDVQLVGDTLHFLSSNRSILDKRTGAVLEQREGLAFSRRLPDTMSGQTVFITPLDGTLRAIDSVSLEPRWTLKSTCASIGEFQAPTVVSNTVYVGSGCYTLHAVDLSTGNIVWTYRPNKDLRVESPIAVLDDIGYAIYSDASLRALDLSSGEFVGSLQVEPAVVPGVVHGAGVAAGNGHVYAYFGGRELFAFSKGIH